MPENQVMIPFATALETGDGAFDACATFEASLSPEEHIDRFYRSLRYLQIDRHRAQGDGGNSEKWWRATYTCPAIGDWWVGQRSAAASTPWATRAETIPAPMSYRVLPLPLAKRAPLYDGAQVITTTVPTAPSMLSPRAKTTTT